MDIGKFQIPQLVDSKNQDRVKDCAKRREAEFYLPNVGYGTAHFDEELKIWKLEGDKSLTNF